MISTKPGVRPINCSRNTGLTLIELMVTIALVGVVTALALPSFTDMVQKRKLTSSAQQLAAFINQGHTEAARRNEPITISYDRDSHTDWCVGATLGEDACDCTETESDQSDFCAIDGITYVVNNVDFGSTQLVHRIDGNGSFSFDPVRGILLDPNDELSIELHTDSRDFKIDLKVNESGNLKLCSHDADHEVPGYEVC